MIIKNNYPNICSWWDYSEPSTKELDAISKEVGLDMGELQKLMSKETRPKIEDLEKFSLILFKAPITEGSAVLTASIAIFLNEKKVITLREHKQKGIENLLK